MNSLSLPQILPNLSQFDKKLSQIDDNFDPLALMQPKLVTALKQFLNLQNINSTLFVVSSNSFFDGNLLVEYIKNQQNLPAFFHNSFDLSQLFDRYSVFENTKTVFKEGVLSQIQPAYLVINAKALLEQSNYWQYLKLAIQKQAIEPISLTPNYLTQDSFIAKNYQFKLIILGSRESYAHLTLLDPQFTLGFARYSEIENIFAANIDNIGYYKSYVNWLCEQNSLPILTNDGLKQLMLAGMRYLEDRSYLPLESQWHLNILSIAAQISHNKNIGADHILTAIATKRNSISSLPERALQDIFDGQIIIETTGSKIGQINGLTVVEINGLPISYGEPVRISAVAYLGDGDISDIERKVELAGSIHAKGMMIMQSLLATTLELDSTLPFASSIVFEQSYSDIDGDSASLAHYCSLLSALAKQPILQSIAVTGAIDQFGQVLPIGGINEKITGFYKVCKHQGLTGSQGVILPKANIQHLILDPEILGSIKVQQFHLWAVENVAQAVELLMQLPLVITNDQEDGNNDEENSSIVAKIKQRINQLENSNHSLWNSLLGGVKNLWNRT